MDKRLTAPEAAVLRGHCRVFSSIGGALAAQMAGTLAAQAALTAAVGVLAPSAAANPVLQGFLSALSSYGVGFFLFWLILRNVPAAPAQEVRGKLPPKRFFQVLLISVALLYLFNYATVLLVALVGILRGKPVSNPVQTLVEYPWAVRLVLACVLAPVAEELAFRRMLLRRLRPYGEKFAVAASALCFALFHGNLNQMLYAFALGLVFGYVALKSGGVRQTVLLHALVNLVGSIVFPALGEHAPLLTAILMLLCVIFGMICLLVRAREVRFPRDGYAMAERRKWRLFFENPGMICFCLLTVAVAASYFIW